MTPACAYLFTDTCYRLLLLWKTRFDSSYCSGNFSNKCLVQDKDFFDALKRWLQVCDRRCASRQSTSWAWITDAQGISCNFNEHTAGFFIFFFTSEAMTAKTIAAHLFIDDEQHPHNILHIRHAHSHILCEWHRMYRQTLLTQSFTWSTPWRRKWTFQVALLSLWTGPFTTAFTSSPAQLLWDEASLHLTDWFSNVGRVLWWQDNWPWFKNPLMA